MLSAAGDAAELRLDELARRAGVGSGTLYRHFPDRDALLRALYADALDRIAAAARHLAWAEPPLPALRSWLLLFVDYLATKRLVVGVLGASPPANGGSPVSDAVRMLAARAVATAELRADLDPVDLLRALVGLSTLDAHPGWQGAARRMVDILLAGAAPGTPRPTTWSAPATTPSSNT
ncbi:MAG: TetR/AcrR family transcriptional regulator [Gluconacetobacter diazotrophicus]|nr:TetR/AcrR family transcriptional regulator [Gluconacetobacter diazotrophicus]